MHGFNFLYIVWLLSHVVIADDEVDGSSIYENRGYPIRDFQLVAPYATSGHWDFVGDALLTSNKLRLTRNENSLRGSIWSRNTVTVRDWELIVGFRVSGESTPADGLSIWYTQHTGTGSAYGAPELFSGIGVAVDTYPNRKNGVFTKADVITLFNDGTKKYDDSKDGLNLAPSGDISCNFDFALRDGVDIRTKNASMIMIRYTNNVLSIYHSGRGDTWSLCNSYNEMYLPINYHLGLSASTGDLNSSHEILFLKLYQLQNTDSKPAVASPQYQGSVGNVPENVNEPGSGVFTFFKWVFYLGIVAVLLVVAFFGWKEYSSRRNRKSRFY
ncbi:unnamed protein product [Auanema sp. JU1783]|nr:unnamed protein product [Auanema sp. JU1783]